jgi:predicted metal-dependent enzyme (double-stranded beta helix superfamily)
MKTWVKVVKGELTLQRHGSNDRRSPVVQETVLAENSVLFFDDSIGSHRIRNQQGTEVAVSLHIYSPPMLGCSGVPTVFCQEAANSLSAAERIVIHSQYPHNILYTNFKSLIDALHMELATPMSAEDLSGEIGATRRRHVQQLLTTMRFNPNEWMQYARFKDGRYTRNLVGHGENFTVVLMCWEKKQMGPIHDHCGSDGWIKVLDGQLHEFVYDVADDTAASSDSAPLPAVQQDEGQRRNAIRQTSENVITAEEVSCISGNGVHNLGNPSSDQIVVSLHVYSPPHSICNFYDARTGVKTVSTLMAVNGVTPSEGGGASATSNEGDDRSAKRVRLSVEPPSEQVNLAKFLMELKPQLSEDQDGQRVLQLLKRLALHESEWRQCVVFDSDNYTRTLVALEPSFSVVLICWNGGQGSPIHDHGKGTRSWAKVLEGTMEMRRYERNGGGGGGGGGRGSGGGGRSRPSGKQPAVMDEKQFQQGECLMETEYTGLHKLGNKSDTARAVSLHVYSPPCTSHSARKHSIRCSCLFAHMSYAHAPLKTLG